MGKIADWSCMQSEPITTSTIIQAMDGNCYEILNSITEMENIMFDDFIKPDTFIKLMLPDGIVLHIRKSYIVAFYKSE